MSISLRRLRYFRSIASNGSLSAAARELNVAQPALSHHIRKLEADLDVKLLVRSSRGVELTPAGRIFAIRAGDILQQIKDTETEIREQIKEPNGRVAIAMIPSLARHVVPVLLRILEEAFPRIELSILDAPSASAAEFMNSQKAELALVPNPVEIREAKARAIYKEPVHLVKTSSGGVSDNSPIKFADIADIPLILPNQEHDVRRRLEEVAIENRIQLNVRFNQSAPDVIYAIVYSGMAATIIEAAAFASDAGSPALDIRQIVDPQITRTHSIVRHANAPRSLAVDAVEDSVAKAIAVLVSEKKLRGELCP